MNILLIIFGILALIKVMDGWKKGMVKEILSFLSLIVICVTVALAANGLKSYLGGSVIGAAVMGILLVLLGIVHHLLRMALFPVKVLSKLPVVHGLDKVLGVVAGLLETVLVIWTVYAIIMLLDTGMVGEVIRSGTAESSILTWFYEHNYLARFLENTMEQFDFANGALELLHG